MPMPLSNAFGKQFYVENKVGAGGMIASEEVARAKPDGYTLMVSGIPTHVLGPAMNKNVSFDPMRYFTHIAFFGGAPNAFVVHRISACVFADFMARAKSESAGIEVSPPASARSATGPPRSRRQDRHHALTSP